MKILIVTQAVDTEDPVLGFFVRWLKEFSKHIEHIEVICLKEGNHNFYSAKNAVPRSENSEEFSGTGVRVHSLGKTASSKQKAVSSRIRYIVRFLVLAWKLRKEYDAVFVHMNQEYVLIAGWLWKLLGKRVYLWRNHYTGSLQTDIAAAFCTKVFCTSTHSYTAKYKKTVLMPVGVDTERFTPDASVERKPHSILFLSRMSPSKRPEMLIDALASLVRDNREFTASFIGSPLPRDEAYYEGLKEKVRSLGLTGYVSFHPGIPNSQTPDLYRAHEIFVNASPSGMLDKTIFEASASGCLVLAASEDFRITSGDRFWFPTEHSEDLARKLTVFLEITPEERKADTDLLQDLVRQNDLSVLVHQLVTELSS